MKRGGNVKEGKENRCVGSYHVISGSKGKEEIEIGTHAT